MASKSGFPCIVWFRDDLRLSDHPALHAASKSGAPLNPCIRIGPARSQRHIPDIDWRKGEKWFWDTLVDADPGSNPANWQWVAGSGADAAPYFRVFNPILQGEKFDPDGAYVRLSGAGCRSSRNCRQASSIGHGARRRSNLRLRAWSSARPIRSRSSTTRRGRQARARLLRGVRAA